MSIWRVFQLRLIANFLAHYFVFQFFFITAENFPAAFVDGFPRLLCVFYFPFSIFIFFSFFYIFLLQSAQSFYAAPLVANYWRLFRAGWQRGAGKGWPTCRCRLPPADLAIYIRCQRLFDALTECIKKFNNVVSGEGVGE